MENLQKINQPVLRAVKLGLARVFSQITPELRSFLAMAFTAAHIGETRRKSPPAHAFLVVKNVLFWGSMALTGYLLFFMASLVFG
ncbi:hypothetical protein [Roseibium polysiphoniae]|uniref:Uncharacterized protein n=1 Tax=Roseibium polysiphoniae TaxID=2571221 RepID=A0ABR9C4H5_9HYPH|nr:hypothetical protein [Roseibium polysiphoniae]MBD8874736.1 hypothetical protein [Roseibium polysiphoniae]